MTSMTETKGPFESRTTSMQNVILKRISNYCKRLKLKQTGENIAAKMDGESVVIHQEPQIANSPISPNVTLNLTLGAVGGFLLSPLLALP